MKKPAATGRTRLLTSPDGQEKASTPDDVSHVPHLKPRAWRSDVPLSHGKHSEQQVEAWDKEGKARRVGQDRTASACELCGELTLWPPWCGPCRVQRWREGANE